MGSPKSLRPNPISGENETGSDALTDGEDELMMEAVRDTPQQDSQCERGYP